MPAHPVAEARWRRTVRARLVANAQQAALDDFVSGFNRWWRARTACAVGFRRHAQCGNRR